MSEWMMIDLYIEEYLQMEIKDSLSHNNKSFRKWFDLSYEERNKNRVN